MELQYLLVVIYPRGGLVPDTPEYIKKAFEEGKKLYKKKSGYKSPAMAEGFLFRA